MKAVLKIVLLLVFTSLASCRHFDLIYEKGTIVDIGNCIVIQTEKRNQTIIYHPVNLDKFDLNVEDGDTVVFRFIAKDYITPCQTGTTVDLISIKKK